MNVRNATESDLAAIQWVHQSAFGQEVEAALVRDLLADPSARPMLSLVAEIDADVVGHVLFTAVRFETADAETAAILAPLAVMPGHQGSGIGRALVEAGLQGLKQSGTGLVFVFGDPAYYGRFGFGPAAHHGLDAPYPIPPAYADAWMVAALDDSVIGKIKGRLRCADTLSQPELWEV